MDEDKKQKLRELAQKQNTEVIPKEDETVLTVDETEYQKFLDYKQQRAIEKQKQQQQQYQQFQQFQQFKQQQEYEQQMYNSQASRFNNPPPVNYQTVKAKRFGRKQIITVGIIFGVFLIILTAFLLWFLGFRYTPEKAVKDYLNQYEKNVTTNIEKNMNTSGAMEAVIAMENTGDDIQYEIANVEKLNDGASVKVAFTFKDHSDAMTEALNDYLSNAMTAYIMGNNINTDNLSEILYDAVIKALANEEPAVSTKTIIFQCTHNGLRWTINKPTSSIQTDLRDVYTGNALKVMENMFGGSSEYGYSGYMGL